MKRVLFLINSLNRGGAERVFVNQMNFLCREGKSSQVWLALLYKTKSFGYLDELTLPKERMHTFSARDEGLFSTFFRVLRLVKQEKIETVYATTEIANILARLLKIFCPKLTIIIRDSGTGVRSDKTGRAEFKNKKFKLLDILLNVFASRIIVLSDEMRTLALGYEPMYRSKMVVLENGVDIVHTEFSVKKCIQEKLQQKNFRVLLVGSMNVKERAYEDALQALANILEQEPGANIRFVFAGDGILADKYKQVAEDLHVSNFVDFLGRLSTESLLQEYERASILLLSSTAEGSPNVILEAMSYGLPVVSTAVGGAVSMVTDGKTGYLVSPQNPEQMAAHILELSRNKERYADFALAGYEKTVAEFSLSSKMQILLPLLDL